MKPRPSDSISCLKSKIGPIYADIGTFLGVTEKWHFWVKTLPVIFEKTVDPILGLGYDIDSLVVAVVWKTFVALNILPWSHMGHLNFGENHFFENAKKLRPIELV